MFGKFWTVYRMTLRGFHTLTIPTPTKKSKTAVIRIRAGIGTPTVSIRLSLWLDAHGPQGLDLAGVFVEIGFVRR
jgi:hypothetical protein